MRILFLGDVVGGLGRQALKAHLPVLKSKFSPEITVVNGENSAGGLGITPETAKEIFAAGADLITTGNHVWGKREVFPYLNAEQHRIIRPLNSPEGAPGSGWAIVETAGARVLFINALGRVFMNDLVDCPFRAVESLLQSKQGEFDLVFLDFHAEATSEKIAMGYFLAGKVAAVVGTHTHVQTADERLLQGKTAFISDVGMCGPHDSVIGVDADIIVKRFYTGLPGRFSVVEKGPVCFNGVVIDCDAATGSATSIERINDIV